MTKKERTAKTKRIEKAIETLCEVESDFWECFTIEQRCALREAKRPLEYALKFHKA